MFDSLVLKDALLAKQTSHKIDYENIDDFYPCDVILSSGSYLYIAPLFFAPMWVLSNLVQISEENYYELVQDESDCRLAERLLNALIQTKKRSEN